MLKQWSLTFITKILNEEPVTEPNTIAIRNIMQKRMTDFYEAVVKKSGFLLMIKPKFNVEKDLTLLTIKSNVCPADIREFDTRTERFIKEAVQKNKKFCRIIIIGTKPSESSREYFEKSFIDYIFFNHKDKIWESRFVGK